MSTLNCEIGMLNLQKLSRYYKGASFLPRLNNEIAKSHNENTLEVAMQPQPSDIYHGRS
jgi:hypothetical protein